jgi:O-antigen ligase
VSVGIRTQSALAGRPILAWNALLFRVALLFSALALGVAAVALPPLAFALILAGAIVVVGTGIEPLFGLGVTLLVAPFGALERIALPRLVPVDTGHVLLGLTLAAWFARRNLSRRLKAGAEVEGRPDLRPVDVALLAFLGVGAFSLAGALSLQYGLEELLKWLELGAVMGLVRAEARVPRRRNAIIALVLLSGLVQAGIGIWQFAFRHTGPEEFLILGRFYRAYGSFEQPNPFAGFMGLLLPLALGLALAEGKRWGRAILFLLAAAALGVALIMSWSRGAWLGSLAALATLVVFAPRHRPVGLVLLFAAIALGGLAWGAGLLPESLVARLSGFSEYTQVYDVRGVDITEANFAVLDRLAHWGAAVDMLRDHPWLGVGLGNYEPVYPAYARLNWPNALGHAHNIYLNFAAETGLIGLAAYLVFWALGIALTLRSLGRARGLERGLVLGLLGAWVHLSVHNLVDNLYVNGVYLHIGALLGLLTAIAYGQDHHQR